jgi:hypothetical protein
VVLDSAVMNAGPENIHKTYKAKYSHNWFRGAMMSHMPNQCKILHIQHTKLLLRQHKKSTTRKHVTYVTWACRRMVSLSRVLSLCRTLYGAYFVPTWAASRFGSFSLANSACKGSYSITRKIKLEISFPGM